MARINRGILGGFRGKLANVVGSAWKGIDTMRALPISVANPRTAAQVAQRSKLASVVAFAKIWLTAIIRPYWNRFAVKMSGYNEFIKANIAAFDSEGVLDPNLIKMTLGKLLPLFVNDSSRGAGQATVTFNWVNTAASGNGLLSDKVGIVGFNVEYAIYETHFPDVTRAAGQVTIPTPVNIRESDDYMEYFLFAYSADGTRVADSELVRIQFPS